MRTTTRAELLRALVEDVGAFHLRDRALRRAQSEMRERIEAGGEVSSGEAADYLKAVARYFGGFAREANAHLRDIEKRLAHVAQVQFNLTAERGVAVRRVEITQGVLSKLAELDRP